MKDRIKYIRENLPSGKLSQSAFGARIGVGRDVVANIEGGRVAPSAIIIQSICREFGADRVWLETGVGEPFAMPSREEEIAAVFGDALSGQSAKGRLIRAIASLPDDACPALADAIVQVADELK